MKVASSFVGLVTLGGAFVHGYVITQPQELEEWKNEEPVIKLLNGPPKDEQLQDFAESILKAGHESHKTDVSLQEEDNVAAPDGLALKNADTVLVSDPPKFSDYKITFERFQERPNAFAIDVDEDDHEALERAFNYDPNADPNVVVVKENPVIYVPKIVDITTTVPSEVVKDTEDRLKKETSFALAATCSLVLLLVACLF